MKRIICFSVLALFVCLVAASGSVAYAQSIEISHQVPVGTIRYVKPGGIGTCTTWDDACELQTALTGAVSGEEIWVRYGTYRPTSGTGRTATFAMQSGVAIYGGFAGIENEREQRDWVTNVTILSGDIGVVEDNSDNSYHVVTANGLDETAILDGFTITGGKADGGSASDYGSGLYNNNGSPMLLNLIFTKNTAAERGGGIYNYGTSHPTLMNVIFAGNSATDGGGILNYGSSLTLINVIFSGNSATNGGGVYNFHSSPTMINVTFAGNSASSGAGVYNIAGNPTIANAVLWGNAPDQINNGTASIPVISYSDIQGGCPVGSTCTQVINLDPQFIRNPSPGGDGTWGTSDDDYGDLHLQLTSTVIDAGDNTVVPTEVTTDLEGTPRFIDIYSIPDTGNGTAPIVDMGAYETYDEVIPPTVESIERDSPNPTNAASVDFTIAFSEEVIDVDVGDFTLSLSGITGASVTEVNGGPLTYTVEVFTGTGDGTLRLDVPDTASITDLAGNPLADLPYTDGESYTIDKTAPTVTSSLRDDPSPTNAASVDYAVTFSEAVSSVDMDDFDLTVSGITGAAVTEVSGGPTTYTVAVSTGTGSGTLRLDVPGTASITDAVGNSLSELPYTDGELYFIDRIAPEVVSILRADPNPTNAHDVNYTVTFSEEVSGVGVSDFSLTTTGIDDAEVDGVSGGPTIYTVTVDAGKHDGTLRLDIPASATITDVLGNVLTDLPYTSGETYTIDRDDPEVISILRADPSPTKVANVNYTVTFSEAVTGVATNDFILTLSEITGASVTDVSGGPTIYTVVVSTGTGSGTLRLDVPNSASITDAAGNSLEDLPYTNGQSYTIDKTAPTVDSSLRADPSPTNADGVHYTITFSEAVSGVDADDFTLTSLDITDAAVTEVSGGPMIYTVIIFTGTMSGTLRLDVPGTASVTDLVGNSLSDLPYTGGQIYTIDRTAPTVISIVRADPSPTNADSVNFTVTFSEDVEDVDVNDFSLFIIGNISGSSVTSVSGTGSIYTVTVAVGTGAGLLRLDIPGAASITDLVGNSLSELPYQSGQAYMIYLQIYLPLMANHTP